MKLLLIIQDTSTIVEPVSVGGWVGGCLLCEWDSAPRVGRAQAVEIFIGHRCGVDKLATLW